MGSYFRDYYCPTATQRPTVGDTKFSVVPQDHMGWLKCDGRLVSKTQYNFLYQVIGDSFGTGTDTQFYLPNAVGRVPGVIGSNTSNIADWKLGDTPGEDEHTLTIAEMPRHTHGSSNATGGNDGDGFTGYVDMTTAPTDVVTSLNVGTTNVTALPLGVGVVNSVSPNTTPTGISPDPHRHSIGTTGNDQAHNNIQPTIFMGNLFIFSGKVGANSSNYYPYAAGTVIF